MSNKVYITSKVNDYNNYFLIKGQKYELKYIHPSSPLNYLIHNSLGIEVFVEGFLFEEDELELVKLLEERKGK